MRTKTSLAIIAIVATAAGFALSSSLVTPVYAGKSTSPNNVDRIVPNEDSISVRDSSQ
jgi:hypothetical protein